MTPEYDGALLMKLKLFLCLLICLIARVGWSIEPTATIAQSAMSTELKGGKVVATSLQGAVEQVLAQLKREVPEVAPIKVTFSPDKLKEADPKINMELRGLSVALALQYCCDLATSYYMLIKADGLEFQEIYSPEWGMARASMVVSDALLQKLGVNRNDEVDKIRNAMERKWRIALDDFKIEGVTVSFANPGAQGLNVLRMEIAVMENRLFWEAQEAMRNKK